MNNLTKLAVICLSIGTLTVSHAKTETYNLDPYHTNARFTIDHFNTSSNVGGFFGLQGNLKFDEAKQQGAIDITIPVSSLQASTPLFTEHLKKAEWFNAAQYPTLRFVSKHFNVVNSKLQSVDGELTLLGQTKLVTLHADKFNCYDSPMLNTRTCGGDFSTVIDRTQWGMDNLVDKGMSKTVNINIQVEAGKVVKANKKRK